MCFSGKALQGACHLVRRTFDLSGTDVLWPQRMTLGFCEGTCDQKRDTLQQTISKLGAKQGLPEPKRCCVPTQTVFQYRYIGGIRKNGSRDYKLVFGITQFSSSCSCMDVYN